MTDSTLPVASLRAEAEDFCKRWDDCVDCKHGPRLVGRLLAALAEQDRALALYTVRRRKWNVEADTYLAQRDELTVRLAEQERRIAGLQEHLIAAAQLLRSVRTLDCGAHYCRYCPAKSPAWEHSPSCPYVESQREKDEARALIAEIEALGFAALEQER